MQHEMGQNAQLILSDFRYRSHLANKKLLQQGELFQNNEAPGQGNGIDMHTKDKEGG